MDHKVSKDMISSGMIPSGEKTQADLGRIQYGSNPSPSSLADAYKSIYEHHQKDKDGNTIPHEGEELNEGKMPEGLKNYLMKKKGKKEDKKDMKEENIDEVAPLALAIPAIAKGAAALMTKKAVAGAALKLGSKAAAKTILKKGVAGAAKQGAMAAGKGIMKKPVETAVVASALKPGPKMPSTPINPRAKMTGARTAGVYASADLFDIVKGQLLDEGIDEKEALKIMVELSQQDLNTIVNEGIGQMKLLPTVAALAGGAVATQQIASRMGKKSGEESIKPNKPNKPNPIKDLIPNLKKKKEATEKSIQSM